MEKTKGGDGLYRLILEPMYAESVWCRQIVQGLSAELKKRREEFTVDAPALEGDTVFIIGTQPSWLSSALAECNGLGITPILLCNSQRKLPGGRYHCVCSDIFGSMRQLTAGLKQQYGSHLALYGINPDSVGDRSRQAAFQLECPEADRLFVNEGSLGDCYRRFRSREVAFDAVICTNGFAAISLYRRLAAEKKPIPPIISCAQTLLTGYYQGPITSVDMNYGRFGKTALALADLARKQPQISEVTATVQWSLPEPLQVPLPAIPTAAASSGNFYGDEELRQMLTVENLLAACDQVDRLILDMLLQGSSYLQMAEACYLTEGAVKYRVRKMRQLCNAEEKETLTALLKSYLDPK